MGTILEAWFPLGGRGTGIKTLSEHEVITSTDLLIDGGVIAAIRTGEYQLGSM